MFANCWSCCLIYAIHIVSHAVILQWTSIKVNIVMKIYWNNLEDSTKPIFKSMDDAPASMTTPIVYLSRSCIFDDWTIKYDTAWATTWLIECYKDDMCSRRGVRIRHISFPCFMSFSLYTEAWMKIMKYVIISWYSFSEHLELKKQLTLLK